jgi:hypothetical protein
MERCEGEFGEEVPDLVAFPCLYLNEHMLRTSMGILVSVRGSLGIKVFWLVKLYSYFLVGLSSVLIADTLVEGPDEDR